MGPDKFEEKIFAFLVSGTISTFATALYIEVLKRPAEAIEFFNYLTSNLIILAHMVIELLSIAVFFAVSVIAFYALFYHLPRRYTQWKHA